jgi:transmembrane sensor
MTEPERPSELHAVREARWDAERGQRALGGVHARLARRERLSRQGVLALAAAACMLAAFALWPASPAEVARPAHQDAGRSLRFADGSTVQLLDARSEVEVTRVAPEQVEVALSRGRGHFSVTPDAKRTFVVHAAHVTIVVLGTAFTVVREPMRVHVSVERGRVEVTSGGEKRILTQDEAAWFEAREPLVGAAAEPEPQALEPLLPAPVESTTPAVAVARARFLEHARRRQYARAMEVIRQRPGVVHDTAEDLMLAADAARLSGDAAAAVTYLKRVAQRHPRDSRAPLAAFTLGRILLFELDRPAEAREAYALTRKLSAQGALAEDALAREVEAAARAGQSATARALADEYLARYPNGQRRAQVQKLSGRP